MLGKAAPDLQPFIQCVCSHEKRTGTTANSCPRGEVQSVKPCEISGAHVSCCAALQRKEEGRQPRGSNVVNTRAGEYGATCAANRQKGCKGEQ